MNDFARMVVEFALAFGVFAFAFLLIILQKKNPTTIIKNKDKKYPDSYIVSVWNVSRFGAGCYCDYLFIKKKNGKYRMKYGIPEWFLTIMTVVPFTALYIWIVVKDWGTILKYPLELIPPYGILGILFILLVLLLNNGKLRVRLYFYKFLRDIR